MAYNISTDIFSEYINLSVTGMSVDYSNATTISYCTLETLNARETRRRIVPLAYLTLIMIFGIPGNILIMFIYTTKYQKKATHRTFVVALALTDFLVCILTIPFEIGQMTHEVTFYAGWLCKFGRTLSAIFTTASALILVALSANRYRRICFPLRTQLRKSHALKCLGYIACISVLLSWPEGIFSGLKLDYLGNNQTSHDCSNDDEYSNTNYPMIYSLTILVIYILCMVSLLIMCFLIGREILRHDEFRNQFRSSNMLSTIHQTKSINTQNAIERNFEKTVNEEEERTRLQKTAKSTQITKKLESPINVTKTSLVVSIFFFVGFLPYLVIKLIAAVTEGDIMPPCQLASILLPTMSRTHFLNNVANFIIYLCMDVSFRRNCKAIFTKATSNVFRFVKIY